MKFLDNFDINAVADEGKKEDRSFDPVPAGMYRVICERAEETVTKKTQTDALKFAWRIAEGPHEGQWLWHQLDIDHPTTGWAGKCQNLFREICKATGIIDPQGSLDSYPGSECVVEVGLRPAKGEYPASNEIKSYLAPVPKDSETPVQSAPKRAGNSEWQAP